MGTVINQHLSREYIFENGYLILCLTDNENIGYQDQEKPIYCGQEQMVIQLLLQFSEELDPESSKMKIISLFQECIQLIQQN